MREGREGRVRRKDLNVMVQWAMLGMVEVRIDQFVCIVGVVL